MHYIPHFFLKALTLIVTWIDGSGTEPQAPESIQAKTIYIYNDEGTSKPYVWGASVTLEQVLTSNTYHIQHIDAETVKAGLWRDDAACFIMPGGADLPYLEKLTPEGNEQITAYVSEGGLYIGFCAGAYYASDAIIFSPGTDMEVTGERPLQFFPGISYGPILAPYDYQTPAGSRLALLTHAKDEATSAPLPIFYNGGGTFVNASTLPDVRVITYYQNQPLNLSEEPSCDPLNKAILENGAPAIIETYYGKGKALLFGCHPEMPTAFIKIYFYFTQNPHIGAMIPTLEATNNERLAFMADLLSALGLQVKNFQAKDAKK